MQTDVLTFEPTSMSTDAQSSLPSPSLWPSGACLALGAPAGSQTVRNGTGCPSAPPPALPDRPEARHLWQVGTSALSCSGHKNKRSSFLRGGRCQREPPPRFPQRAFSGEERAAGPEPRFRAPSGHTLRLASGSGLHVQGRRNCISVVSTVRGRLRARRPPRAGLATWPRGRAAA